MAELRTRQGLSRPLLYLAIAVGCIALGLLVRSPWLPLPRPVAKYGGSILWAMMVCFGLRALTLRWRLVATVVLAMVLVALGEATQLISIPWFDAVRATALGHLIFGRTFAFEDIAAYWIGILLAAGAERLVLRRRT